MAQRLGSKKGSRRGHVKEKKEEGRQNGGWGKSRRSNGEESG